MKGRRVRVLIRNFVLEMLIYAALVVGYFYAVLRLLDEPLKKLFASSLVVYGFVALGLIVAQAVVLEFVTSFLIEKLGLDRLE